MIIRRLFAFHNFNMIRKRSIASISKLLKLNSMPLEEIHVKGWVNVIRAHKGVVFIGMKDGSCAEDLQVVIPETHMYLDDWTKTTKGSCIQVTGKMQSSRGKMQRMELVVNDIQLIGGCDSKEYPFKPRVFHDSEYIRQFPHLRARANTFASLLRVRNSFTQAIHNVLQEDGYIQVDTPILTGNDCEGAGEVFQVEPADSTFVESTEGGHEGTKNKHFFNVPTFLTVSAQLHLETITGAFLKAYTFGPIFRADKSQSRHHLSEFYMLEAEVAFISDIEELCKVIENLIQKSVEKVVTCHETDVERHWKLAADSGLKAYVENLISKPFVRMTYTEAIDVMKHDDANFVKHLQWGDDLHKEHEKYLVHHCGDRPVFIVDFPTKLKPFYMKENEDGKTVGAVDLLLPGVGEVCGGSLREERYDVLKHKLTESGMQDCLQWYLDLRKFGTCPHGGFGLGYERLLQAILGIDNIKDTIPFPRSTHNCKL